MVERLLAAFVLWLCWSFSLAAEIEGSGLTALPERPAAPEFSLPDIDGEVHRLSDYRGKVVLINFWATWCPPCRFEMPAMQRAWQQVRDEGIVILAIDVGEDEETIFTFTADYPMDFPLLMDQDAKVIGQWGVRGLPTSFVVDPQGRVVYRAVGGRAWDEPELLDAIRALRSAQPDTAAGHP